MRTAGTPGHGERARVARRVRAALTDPASPSAGGVRVVRDPAPSDNGEPELLPWLPGADFPDDVRGDDSAPRVAARSASPSAHRAPRLLDRLRARVPIRFDPGRRGAAAVGAAVVVAGVVTTIWVLSSRPHAIAVGDSGPDPTVAAAQSSAAHSGSLTSRPPSVTTSATALVVDVAGKVRRPGLYRLPAGSRVDDAVKAAGGALRGVDLTTLNLAAKLADGQQIAVGTPGAGAPPGGSGGGTAGGGTAGGGASGGGASGGGPVDLNTASLEQLDALPGIGPVLAQHILDWRAAHGRFSTVDQLREVSGIGPAKFATLRPVVTV